MGERGGGMMGWPVPVQRYPTRTKLEEGAETQLTLPWKQALSISLACFIMILAAVYLYTYTACGDETLPRSKVALTAALHAVPWAWVPSLLAGLAAVAARFLREVWLPTYEAERQMKLWQAIEATRQEAIGEYKVRMVEVDTTAELARIRAQAEEERLTMREDMELALEYQARSAGGSGEYRVPSPFANQAEMLHLGKLFLHHAYTTHRWSANTLVKELGLMKESQWTSLRTIFIRTGILEAGPKGSRKKGKLVAPSLSDAIARFTAFVQAGGESTVADAESADTSASSKRAPSARPRRWQVAPHVIGEELEEGDLIPVE